MFYIALENDIHTLLYASGIQKYLAATYPEMIFPSVLSDGLLANFNIYPVVIREVTENLVSDALPYTRTVYSNPYKELDTWYVNCTREIDNQVLLEAWATARAERNTLLANTDWIENSDILTDETKDRYKIYRQLLRDCLSIVEYPHQVYIPLAPAIKQTTQRSDVKLSTEEYNQIKNYVPSNELALNWHMFITSWSRTGFTRNRQFVDNLMQLMTDLSLTEVLV